MTDPADRAAVTSQIGRSPRGEWSVARRCACGLPQVIETAPRLEDGTPFPTLWWLTCRALNAEISRLEHEGWMKTVNARIESDPDFFRDLSVSTGAYVDRRNAIDDIGQSGHPGGGPERVKCLHAHTAHFLITSDNPVGRAVLEELEYREPDEPCV